MDFSKDYYGILGVSRTSSSSDIRSAYRALALRWHPDMHAGESPEKIKEAEERFKEINDAYAVLSDFEQRKIYDRYLAGVSSSSQSASRPSAQRPSQSHSSSGAGASATGSYSRTYQGSSYEYYYTKTASAPNKDGFFTRMMKKMGTISWSDWVCAISFSLLLTMSGFYNGCSDISSRNFSDKAGYETVNAPGIKVPEMKFNSAMPSAEEAIRHAMNISDTIISVNVLDIPDISEYELPEKHTKR